MLKGTNPHTVTPTRMWINPEKSLAFTCIVVLCLISNRSSNFHNFKFSHNMQQGWNDWTLFCCLSFGLFKIFPDPGWCSNTNFSNWIFNERDLSINDSCYWSQPTEPRHPGWPHPHDAGLWDVDVPWGLQWSWAMPEWNMHLWCRYHVWCFFQTGKIPEHLFP